MAVVSRNHQRTPGTLCVLACGLTAAFASPARAADLPAAAPAASGVDWYTGAQTQAVDDSWAVAVDGSTSITSNSSAFGSVTVTTALGTPPTVSGARVRVEGVAGTYSYPGQAVGARVTGYQQEGSLLAGWKPLLLASTISSCSAGIPRRV